MTADLPEVKTLAVAKVETRDREAAHDWLSRLYIPHTVSTARPAENFRFQARSAATRTFAVERLRYDSATEVHTELGNGDLICPVLLRGGFAIDDGAEDVRLGPGDVALYAFERSLKIGWPRFELLILRLPIRHVLPVAAQTGLNPDDLRFESVTPVSDARARHWRYAVVNAHRELSDPDSAAMNPLVATHMSQLLAASLLVSFPNTTMDHTQLHSPGSVAPAAVRRAAAFIDANAGRPITVSDIAAAARLSPRALQYAFIRHYDTTPSAYLRRVRLERAHHALQAADPARGDTVAAIAASWGFRKAGHFAAVYRRTYGVHPSRTLQI